MVFRYIAWSLACLENLDLSDLSLLKREKIPRIL